MKHALDGERRSTTWCTSATIACLAGMLGSREGCGVLGNSSAARAAVFETVGSIGAVVEEMSGLRRSLLVAGSQGPGDGSRIYGDRSDWRAFAECGEDQRGGGADFRAARVRLDRREDYAVWPWSLLCQRRALRLRDHRPHLGDYRRERSWRKFRHVSFSGGGGSAGGVGGAPAGGGGQGAGGACASG